MLNFLKFEYPLLFVNSILFNYTLLSRGLDRVSNNASFQQKLKSNDFFVLSCSMPIKFKQSPVYKSISFDIFVSVSNTVYFSQIYKLQNGKRDKHKLLISEHEIGDVL